MLNFFVSSHANVKHNKSIQAAGFTIDNAIRTEITVSEEITDEQLLELLKVLKDLLVKQRQLPCVSSKD